MAAAELALPTGRLATRVVVGAGLIVVACAAVYAGGQAFEFLVNVAIVVMFTEWCVMHGINRSFRIAGMVLLWIVVGLKPYGQVSIQLSLLAASAGLLALFSRSFDKGRAFWVASGILYCGLPGIALIWLRARDAGVELTAWVLFIVWATDIAAFFAGRAIGGPRLAPAISPNKTWAGLGGGVVAAGVVAGTTGVLLHVPYAAYPLALGITGAVLAVLAQGGDLFESWLKRRAGVKDSGTLLPGHGGVLDRLDGLVPVAVVAALLVAVLVR